MDNKIKNALASANGLTEQRRIELIREGVRNKYPNPSDEIAVLRKAVAVLFEVISTLHEGEINNVEFAEYHDTIETIKEDVRKALNI